MILGKAYDEIMDKIEVTPEMRERVLRRIREAELTPARPKVLRVPAWKKYLPAAACLALVIAGAAALPQLMRPQLQPPEETEIVQAVPQIEEVPSLEQLSQLVGFEVEERFALPFEAEETVYSSFWRELAQIRYSGRERTAVYRQSMGEEDNSGDYNSYADVIQADMAGRAVTLKGEDGTYTLALWTDGTFSYSLSLSQGVPEEKWTDILSGG